MCTRFHCHVATLFCIGTIININATSVLLYENLYCYFACNLKGRQGLIKNSAKVKFPQLSSALMSRLELFRQSPKMPIIVQFILFIYLF